MLPYKDVVDRLLESEKITTRVNVAVHKYGREINVCDHPNVNDSNLVYHVFGELVHKSPKRVKGDMEGFILEHYEALTPVIQLFIKPLKLDHYSYITRITQDNVRPDVMCIYLLSKMYGKHVAIVTEHRVWYTFAGEGGVHDCDIVLVFRGSNVFANTKPKQVRWKKPESESNLIFEAGEKIAREEMKDPDYIPYEHKARAKVIDRNPPSRRKAAKTAQRKVRSSYYHDPDYVIHVSEEEESSDSELEILLQEYSGRSARQSRNSQEGTEELVVGTVKIVEQGSSTDEYDMSKYPHIITFTEAVNQGLLPSHCSVAMQPDEQKETVPKKNGARVVKKAAVKPIGAGVQKKTVPSRTFAIKKKKTHSVKCLICRELFQTYRECNAHVIAVHGKEFKCSKCHKKFKARRYLLNHLKRHDMQKLPHQCATCGKRFLHPSDLKEHRIVHSDQFPFHCNWLGCDKKFRFKKDLNKHFIRAHTTTTELQCEHCVQTFDDKRLFEQHQRTHAEPTIPCSLCGKLFRHYSTRNKHMRYCKRTIVE